MFFSQRALCNREEVHSQGDRGGICCKVFFKVIFIIIIIITRPKPAYGRQGLSGSWAVPSGYPNPTRYPVFISIPDPTRFSFRNHRVAGNPKHWVLPDISGKPEVSGTTRYSGYHP